MKLYLARHGRTNYNDLKLCNSDPKVDVHLTSRGFDQAKTLAEKFKQIPLEHIFVSELRRTQQTAEIVNQFHRIKVEVDYRLNDHHTGFEGKPYEELTKALKTADNKWTAHFNNGESIEDLKKRVADFINDLRTKNYNSVLVVTSQWVIYALVTIVQQTTNEEAWNLNISPGGFIKLEI